MQSPCMESSSFQGRNLKGISQKCTLWTVQYLPPLRLLEVGYSFREIDLAFAFDLTKNQKLESRFPCLDYEKWSGPRPVFYHPFDVAGCHLALCLEIEL